MSKKKIQKPERFSAEQYFDTQDTYCPFKGVKVKTAEKPVKKKADKSKYYEIFRPTGEDIVKKNGQLPLSYLLECGPQKSLDLHGKKPGKDDIAALVNGFIEDSILQDLKKVEIITGKGNHSQYEAILPDLVLAAVKTSNLVRDYRYAPSNSGALWIILGHKPKKSTNVYDSDCVRKIDYDKYVPRADDIIDKEGL